MNDEITKLAISHKWSVWKPKWKKFKNKTKYVCPTVPNHFKSSGRRNGYVSCMVATESLNKDIKIHLELLTLWQYENNTSLLEDQELIQKMENKFEEYRPHWEAKRIIKLTKILLTGKSKLARRN